MAPRTAWRGLLTLAQVTCPVRLHAAVVRADRLGFQALNRATLNRVQMRPHDPQTGKEVTREFLVRGYEVEPGNFVMVEDRDLVELQIDSSRVLAFERFVDRASLDTAYVDTPYFLVPDGRAADLAFAVIRDAIERHGRVGVTRIVLGSRERAAIIERRGNGMLLTTLRAAHEVRSDDSYFSEIDGRPPDAALIDMAERLMARLPAPSTRGATSATATRRRCSISCRPSARARSQRWRSRASPRPCSMSGTRSRAAWRRWARRGRWRPSASARRRAAPSGRRCGRNPEPGRAPG